MCPVVERNLATYDDEDDDENNGKQRDGSSFATSLEQTMGKTQHRCLARQIVSVDVLHGHSRFWTFRCTGKEVKHENRDKPIRSLGWPALTWGDR